MNSITPKTKLPQIEDSSILKKGILSILKPYCDIKIIPGSGTSENIILEIRKLKTNVIITDTGVRKFNLYTETVPITDK